MSCIRVTNICAREILDSRGNPTVSTTVTLADGTSASASVPSGASTGSFEAYELRDSEYNERYNGKGVLSAVANVNKLIRPALTELKCTTQAEADKIMTELDGSESLENLGANAVLSVSLALARAGAKSQGVPLYEYLGGISANILPVPMMNILNGGAHAANNIDIQEFMIMPIKFKSFKEALRCGVEIYHSLGSILKAKGLSTTVGDEGGYAPSLETDEEAIALIIQAIKKAGYDTDRVKIALDAAASEWQKKEGGYKLPKRQTELSVSEMISRWDLLCKKYPIVSIEDGLGESDFTGWAELTRKLGKKVQLVGDDLFVTNPHRLSVGIKEGAGNAILIKVNQIGTLTRAIEAIVMAKSHGYNTIISHRSGETEDTSIADLAVALNARQIKTGAPCRSERVAKYNRLLSIENRLGRHAKYGDIEF